MSRANRLALLTRHGKAAVLGGVAEALGLELQLIDDFDTDSLGTFTLERPRLGSQFDAALAKAKLACELSGCRWGLGSEGSFGPDPYLAQAPWGVELLVLHDAQTASQVHAVAQGPALAYLQASVCSLDAAIAFATEIGFPAQGLIIGRADEPWFDKEARELAQLRQRAEQSLLHGELWLETDMRAHRNPSRMAMIAQAGQALAQRLHERCPRCEARGWAPVGLISGARCDCCGHATSAARAQRLQCAVCRHEEEKPLRETVPAARCELCKP